jgi:hypothetical protein
MHPFSWINYYANYLYNYTLYFFNLLINLNFYFYNLTYYIFKIFIYSPYLLLITTVKYIKNILTFSSITFILYFISKCWILFDAIKTSALDYMTWFPTSPRLWYYLVSSIDHVITQPFHQIARGSTSFFDVVNSLLPSEKDILQHVINLSNLSNFIVETICINTLMEFTNYDSIIIKYTMKGMIFPFICYFKVISLGFKGIASWLTGWL